MDRQSLMLSAICMNNAVEAKKQITKEMRVKDKILTAKFQKEKTKAFKKIMGTDKSYSVIAALAAGAITGGVGNYVVSSVMNSKSRKIREVEHKLATARNQLKVLVSTRQTHKTSYHSSAISHTNHQIKHLENKLKDLKYSGSSFKDSKYSLLVGAALAAKAAATTTIGKGVIGGLGWGAGQEGLGKLNAKIDRFKNRRNYKRIIKSSRNVMKDEHATQNEKNDAVVARKLAVASLNTKY